MNIIFAQYDTSALLNFFVVLLHKSEKICKIKSMLNKTFQENFWISDFGLEYTKRNSDVDLDELYKNNYGISRYDMNLEFLGFLDRNIKILEVGCNLGNQLKILQRQGFKNLYGIDIQSSAIEEAKKNTYNINFIVGSAHDIPFKDSYFDLVFTSGLLIHISPNNILSVLKEIYRCSKTYIFGFEYFSENETEINYRGNYNVLWKNNYTKLFIENFKNIKLLKEKKYKYINDSNKEDIMYLLLKE